MKKIISLLTLVFLGLSTTLTNAQTTAPKVEVTASKKKVVHAKAGTAVHKTTSTVQLKKDGTPDKRYKVNKTVVVTKKDGTSDKRYKSNKPVVKTKTTSKTVIKK